MKNILGALLSILVASAVFIGCDFVDNNATRIQLDDPAAVDVSFDGYYATTVDTLGREGP